MPLLLPPLLRALSDACAALRAVGATDVRILNTSPEQPSTEVPQRVDSIDGGDGCSGCDWESEVRAKFKVNAAPKVAAGSGKGGKKTTRGSGASKEEAAHQTQIKSEGCLLYTSPSPRDS